MDEELKRLIENIYNLRQRGWGYQKIAKYLGTNHMRVKRILAHGSPEAAIEYYSKKQKAKTDKATVEEKLAKSVTKTILTQLTKMTNQVAISQMQRVFEQGMMVEEVMEDILKEKENALKRIAIQERLKRELLNEALVYYMLGKIDSEKFVRIILACELM